MGRSFRGISNERGSESGRETLLDRVIQKTRSWFSLPSLPSRYHRDLEGSGWHTTS